MDAALTIGRLATAAGVGVETIRYYQRRGLMPAPGRPQQGMRRYDGADLRRLRFIRRAQALGFTLDEIGSLLELEHSQACAETRDLAAHKLALIEHKIADLKTMHQALTVLRQRCDAGAATGSCPIIDALAGD